ncbi:MAG: stage II sporulation protein R, partial [Defluviitaleaceae bacterium]|nr:stage II sporulation protein R [Defluviitaleaceae bacterium]
MKELRILSMSVFFGLVFAVVVAAYTFIYSATTQRDIAENVIRFHVRANSNTGDDQDLKNLVSAEVLDKFSANFSQYTDIADMRELFAQLLPEMEAYAQEIVRSKGYDYEVAASMESVFFPTQFYGDLAFPPGKYETVQILIGEGEGQNWWCLMFPPLCYVDMTATDAGQQQLAQT